MRSRRPDSSPSEPATPTLNEDDARVRFSDVRVVRLATVGAAGPHVVPVTFAVDRNVIYTAVDAKPKRTRALARLKNIAAVPAVALIADHYDEDWSKLWWVRADGRARIVTGGRDFEAAVTVLTAKYPQYRDQAPAGPAIVVDVTRWSGWSAIT